MANVFETSLLCRKRLGLQQVRPQFADPIFWSDVLISIKDPPTPSAVYTLSTDTGDDLVDEFNNQFVATI